MTDWINWIIDLMHDAFSFFTAEPLFNLAMSAVFVLFIVCLIRYIVRGPMV